MHSGITTKTFSLLWLNCTVEVLSTHLPAMRSTGRNAEAASVCVPCKLHTSTGLPKKCLSGWRCNHVTFATICWKVHALDFKVTIRNLLIIPGQTSAFGSRTGSSKLELPAHHSQNISIPFSSATINWQSYSKILNFRASLCQTSYL